MGVNRVMSRSLREHSQKYHLFSFFAFITTPS